MSDETEPGWHEEKIRSLEGLRVGDIVLRQDSETQWPIVWRRDGVQ